MIATDPLSLLFIACFLVGLVFFIVTALMGNLGHGATHGVADHTNIHVGQHSGLHTPIHGPTHNAAHATSKTHAGGDHQSWFGFLNPTSVMFFLLGFGFFGYLFHNIVGFEAPLLTLISAGISGLIIAALLLIALARLFGDSESTTVQDVSDRTGLLGKVSITIQENGIGEVLYVSPGGMRKSVPARSIDGRRLERDQEVVVVNYQNGVAEVDTWDHFINEEGADWEAPGATITDSLDQLRTLLDEAGKTDSQPLVMRNESQKE